MVYRAVAPSLYTFSLKTELAGGGKGRRFTVSEVVRGYATIHNMQGANPCPASLEFNYL